MHEHALIQLVPDIDNNIVISSHIDSRTRKLPINSNNLQNPRQKSQQLLRYSLSSAPLSSIPTMYSVSQKHSNITRRTRLIKTHTIFKSNTNPPKHATK